MLNVNHILTGHNADDLAETIFMNLLRGDGPRLSRCTSVITESDASAIKRSKPFKYVYEKEIVLYARWKKLDYFSTECIYSPEAFRGTARALIKDLERVRPSAILDIIRSGEDFELNTADADTTPIGKHTFTPLEQGSCERCGYITSSRQKICKACTLLDSLTRSIPKISLDTDLQPASPVKVIPAIDF